MTPPNVPAAWSPGLAAHLTEHHKAQTYPKAVAQADADFADLQDADDIPRPCRVRIRRPDDPLTPTSSGP
ncbi:hypothetical protein ACTU45_34860 [Streptomyces sp. 24-1644]|uniref:hypothetical protein n=1 Tax=Streptomyces sp. 24-1644 TaxID=3457315 RepID=UPI003FA7517A